MSLDPRTYKDFLGNAISLGSQVVYPGRQGSSLWMNYGFVEAFDPNNGRPRIKVRRIPLNLHEKERVVWVDNINRCVVVNDPA